MRSAYIIKIELNTKLILTDLEDNRVSINGLDLQVQKQARLNSSPTTPEHPSRLASNSDPPPCSEVQDDTVVQLSHGLNSTLIQL
jgi:hypothetical protein